MDPALSEILSTLTTSVEIILSPNATQENRIRASQICDEFKETSPYCIQCGLILARREYSNIIRHFGLKLLEHAIRFRWNKLSQDEKNNLKQSCLLLISEGTADILEEQPHIKDVVSRLVVEVMKHEWPNLWTTLMSDMYQLCLTGSTQTELVMKVFLRLVEDIVILQTFRHQRRSEVMLALTANMSEILELFINILQENKAKAANLMGSERVEDRQQGQRHTKVCAATLMTLSGYLDWVSMTHIITQNGILLELLCMLLSNTDLQLLAAECLLILVSRKGKVEERKPLLMLFHEGAMSTIWNAAVAAETSSRDEHYYLFLKRLCEILSEMGKQLCVLWGSESSPEVGQPPNFATYLEALVAFTQHSSQMLSSLTQQLWSQFLRHEKVSKDPVFVTFIPRIMETARKTLVKVGYPSQSNSLSCDYARMDFDNDEEFTVFFSNFRAKSSGTLRQVTMLIPKVAYGCASNWLKCVLSQPVKSGLDADGKTGYCNFSSPSFLEWDALTVFLESVMAMLDLEDGSNIDIREDGISLLKSVLTYDTQDPLLLSCLLSCISSLFIFLKYTPETLPSVLQKIFSAVVFNLPGQTKATRSRAVKNVRQHACSGLVKICKQYKTLVFPVFDQLYNHVQAISSDPEQLSQMEKCILVEALILISNEFNNCQRQSSFLEEVMQPVKQLWLSEDFVRALSSADQFMSYVGLDQAPVEPSSADTCGINRSHISYCIHMIVAVLKRSQIPADKTKAAEGGFAVPSGGDHLIMHPATSHVIILMNNVLALFKMMTMLWREESLMRRHPLFKDSYNLSEADKLVLLGIPPPCVDNSGSSNCKQPIERMKNFLTTTHDISCHILASASNLGDGFYSHPGLPSMITHSVLTNLDLLPDYRLRPIIRVFLKAFVQNCPSKYHGTVIIPVLAHICPYMYKRLEAKWQMINQRCQTRTEGSEEEQETQEVIQEQLVRQVSRDYLDLIGAIYSNKHHHNGDAAPVEEKEPDSIEMGPFGRELGELGACCLATESVCEPVVMCVFNGLLWPDTTASGKCASFCFGVLRQLLANQNLSSEAANHFYCLILSALQLHGQHESSQAILLALGSQAYQLLRPHFPDLRNLMLQIPKCTENQLNAYEEKLFSKGPQSMGDKKKKDSYKKLVSEIIGKSVGQQFKRDVQYKCLPNLFKRLRPKQPALEDMENRDIGLTALFTPEPNGHS